MWRRLLLLVKRFNKTEAAIFLMQAVLPKGFPFSQFNVEHVQHGKESRSSIVKIKPLSLCTCASCIL